LRRALNDWIFRRVRDWLARSETIFSLRWRSCLELAFLDSLLDLDDFPDLLDDGLPAAPLSLALLAACLEELVLACFLLAQASVTNSESAAADVRKSRRFK